MKILLLALVYFFSGKLGFALAIDPGNITAVFPPSGIALGALLIFGLHVWPEIFLGSLFLNIQGLYGGQKKWRSRYQLDKIVEFLKPYSEK